MSDQKKCYTTANEATIAAIRSLSTALVELLTGLEFGMPPAPIPAGAPLSRTYPIYANDVKSFNGDAIKTLAENDEGVIVGGYLALWGDPNRKDMGGDYFRPDTELWLERYPNAPTLFHHGLDAKMGLQVIGHRLKAVKDDTGVWIESWLDKSKQYWGMVEPLLKAEKLFYSPGSASHLVKRGPDGCLKSFPIIEDTLTPVPMQHRLLPIEHIKASFAAIGLKEPDLEEEEETVFDARAEETDEPIESEDAGAADDDDNELDEETADDENGDGYLAELVELDATINSALSGQH